MTIFVAHSNADPFNKSLVDALGSLACPVALPFGDAIFPGVWENGKTVQVLVERKRTLDFISSMLNGHHIKQAQDAVQAGFDFVYLVVEGPFAPNRDGMVIVPWRDHWVKLSEIQVTTGHLPDLEYKRLDSYLNQLELYLSIHCRITHHVQETACFITNLYNLFQKPPEEHHTLKNAYIRAATDDPPGFLIPPTLLQKVALQLPDVGWTRARAIADKFGTLQEFCAAVALEDVDLLCEVEGIGKIIANKIIGEAKGKE